MKILVYGAGVLGSYLAHVLLRGGNDVTMLARGQRFKDLQEKGLIIRHYIQCRTTVDKPKITEVLAAEDVYDLIFVVMQYTQLQAVLPALAGNRTKHIILVGNNADAFSMRDYILQNSATPKYVAFGFQSTGGHRENGRVVCVRAKGQMELGDLEQELSWRPLIDKAFEKASYKLTYYNNMGAWLKSHIALIMPLCYAAHACNGDLRQVSRNKKLLLQIIDAIDEGYKVLEALGYPIMPPGEAAFVREKRNIFYWLLKIVTATTIGRLMISDHAMSALDEMWALHESFDQLKHKAAIPTPNWDELQAHIKRPAHLMA